MKKYGIISLVMAVAIWISCPVIDHFVHLNRHIISCALLFAFFGGSLTGEIYAWHLRKLEESESPLLDAALTGAVKNFCIIASIITLIIWLKFGSAWAITMMLMIASYYLSLGAGLLWPNMFVPKALRE